MPNQSDLDRAVDRFNLWLELPSTLTNAQIKALPTTAVTLVPAQGANKVVVPILINVISSFAAAYTNRSGNLALQFGYALHDAACGFLTENSTGFFSQTTRQWVSIPLGVNVDDSGLTYAPGKALSQIANQPLVVGGLNTAGNLTAGDSTNTLLIDLTYKIVTL